MIWLFGCILFAVMFGVFLFVLLIVLLIMLITYFCCGCCSCGFVLFAVGLMLVDSLRCYTCMFMIFVRCWFSVFVRLLYWLFTSCGCLVCLCAGWVWWFVSYVVCCLFAGWFDCIVLLICYLGFGIVACL